MESSGDVVFAKGRRSGEPFARSAGKKGKQGIARRGFLQFDLPIFLDL